MVKAYESHINKLVAPDPKLKRPRFNKGKRVFSDVATFMSLTFNGYQIPDPRGIGGVMPDLIPHITFYGKPGKVNLYGGVSTYATLSAETYPHGRVLFSYGMPIALKTNDGEVLAIPRHLLPTVTTKRHSQLLNFPHDTPYIPNDETECGNEVWFNDVAEYHTDRAGFHLGIAARARDPFMIERALGRAAKYAAELSGLKKLPTEPLITQFVTIKKIALWKLVKNVEIPPILWGKDREH